MRVLLINPFVERMHINFYHLAMLEFALSKSLRLLCPCSSFWFSFILMLGV